MPSLRIISLLATIACAAFSSAAPVTTPADVTNLGKTVGAVDLQGVSSNFPGVPDDIVQGYLNAINPGNAATTPPAQGSQPQSIPEIFVGVANKLVPIVQQMRTMVTVNIEINALAGLLKQIQTTVAGAVTQVQALVADPSGGVLTLAGEVLTIQEVAFIVALPLYLIGTVLVTVVGAVSAVQLTVITPLVGAVGVVVASLLSAVFGLVGGLLPAVVALVQGLVASLVTLNLGVVINVLGLSA